MSTPVNEIHGVVAAAPPPPRVITDETPRTRVTKRREDEEVIIDMTSNNGNNTNSKDMLYYREALLSLEVQRKQLESESDTIYNQLMVPIKDKSGKFEHPPIGIKSPLIDSNGRPRKDIDLVQAQMLRQRYQGLQSDLDALMEQTEDLLEKLALAQAQHHGNEEEKRDHGRHRHGEVGSGRRNGSGPKPVYDVATGKWVCMNWDEQLTNHMNNTTMTNNDDRIFCNIKSNHSSVHSQLSGLTDLDVSSSLRFQQPLSRNNSQKLPCHNPNLQPFARIDAIAEDSPADMAGLHEEDLILQFGPLDYTNHQRLRAIAELVPDAAEERQPIDIIIKRRRKQPSIITALTNPLLSSNNSNNNNSNNDDDNNNTNSMWGTMKITLFPKRWRGRGLIGCHLVPYKD